MAYRLSDDDLRAAKAAAAIRQANQAQRDYDNSLAAANQKAMNAQGKKTGGLSSVLSGIGNSIYNTGKGLFDFFGSGIASIGDLGEGIATGKLGTREEDFKKWLYNTDNEKDAYLKAGGTALETASNLADLIPGAAMAKPIMNGVQGFASGVAQEYIDKGKDADLGEALSKGAISGAASLGGSAIGGKIVGKAAGGTGVISKALNSQVGRGATIGGISGGIGAGLETARQGGNLGEVLANTAGGIGQGALGGGAMAGTMGVLGSLSKRANDKVLGIDGQQNTAKTAVKNANTDTLSNKQKAKLERQVTVNKQRQGGALLEQYGTLDAPTRRAVGAPEEVLVRLYDEYGLKNPAEVQYASNHVTGGDGMVSQMTRELAGSAKKVKTSIDQNWLNEMMDLNGLTDTEAKTVTNQIKAALKRTSVDGYADGNTALDVVKQLEKQSSRYKGKDGTYHNSTPSDQAKGAVLDLVRDELQGRIWDSADDISKVITPERVNQLKAMFPDNQQWASAVDNKIAKAKNGAELRSTMKPIVDGSKIVKGSKMAAGGYAERAYQAATSRNPIVAVGQMAADAVLGSEAAKQIRADKYAKKAAKAEAKLNGTDTSKISGIAGNAAKKIGDMVNIANNESLSNRAVGGADLGLPTVGDIVAKQTARQSGLTQARNVDAEKELQNARQEAINAQDTYQNAMAQAQQNYATADRLSQAQNQGQQQLDRIANAMQLALNAGDITSYAKLADLYQQAYKLYGTQTAAKNLTASQSKALTGMQQLETLAQMTPDAGTAVANSPLGFIVNMTGGNEYANQAKSLATTIGYLLSGATIKPDEAEAIGMAYVPNAFDSEQVKQQKLERARQLLQNYMNTTESLTQ